MTREEFIKQRCEIDKITEEEFEKRYRVVKCNCVQPYCKGYRCLDLNDLLEENQELKKENKILRENAENNDKVVDKVNWKNQLLKQENKQLKDKLSKIETLIINHNCDTGDIYYKYNSKFLKSELKQRILEIVYEVSE